MVKYLSLFFVFLIGGLPVYVGAEKVTPADIKPQVLPVDSDIDKVIDDNDECYKTAPGVNVDERGCPVIVKDLREINLKINFEYDSAVVRPEFYSEIEKVAVFMNENPLTRVIIEGHTDSDGASPYNKILSSKRAQAAAEVLVKKFGIEPLRVTAVGFGEERPLVANDSAANKYKNRRVVAVVRYLKEKRG